MLKTFFFVCIYMWRDMFKFFSPHRINRKDFAIAIMGNTAIFVFLIFLLFIDFFSEYFFILLCNLFGIAISSLFVRRLRDAGLSFVFGLLPYGWVLFWWCILLFFSPSYDERTGIALVVFFGDVPIGFIVLLLCAFPSKNVRSDYKSQSNQLQVKEAENEFLQANIDLWKNIFKFRAPHRTGRREFALSLVGGIFFFLFVMFGIVMIDSLIVGFLFISIILLFMLAFFSLIVRRLRDAGFSVWFVFPALVMLVCISIVSSNFIVGVSVFLELYFNVLLVMCFFPTKENKEVESVEMEHRQNSNNSSRD